MKRARTQSTTSTTKLSRYSKKSNIKNAQKNLVSYQRKASVPRWGFPARMYIAHKYVSAVPEKTVVSTAGSNVGYIVSCNGMFDPDISGTGHQPMYFDNCSAIYDHYTVVKSKIKWTLIPSVNSYTSGAQFATYIDDDASGVASINAAAETQGGNYRVVAALTTPVVFYQEWSARNTFGGDPLSNDDLQGTASANPVEQSSFCIFGNASQLTTQTWIISFEVIYYAIWDELKTQAEN